MADDSSATMKALAEMGAGAALFAHVSHSAAWVGTSGAGVDMATAAGAGAAFGGYGPLGAALGAGVLVGMGLEHATGGVISDYIAKGIELVHPLDYAKPVPHDTAPAHAESQATVMLGFDPIHGGKAPILDPGATHDQNAHASQSPAHVLDPATHVDQAGHDTHTQPEAGAPHQATDTHNQGASGGHLQQLHDAALHQAVEQSHGQH
jgi:hypothetical protein